MNVNFWSGGWFQQLPMLLFCLCLFAVNRDEVTAFACRILHLETDCVKQDKLSDVAWGESECVQIAFI